MLFTQPWEKFFSPVSITSEWNKKKWETNQGHESASLGNNRAMQNSDLIAISAGNPAREPTLLSTRRAEQTIFCCPLQGSLGPRHPQPGLHRINRLTKEPGSFQSNFYNYCNYWCVVTSTVICTQFIIMNTALIIANQFFHLRWWASYWHNWGNFDGNINP